MKFRDYIKDNIFGILCQITGLGIVAVLAYLLGNPPGLICLLGGAWLGAVFVYYLILFFLKKRKTERMLILLEELPEKYVISELLSKPYDQEGLVYYHILKAACKSMMEKVCEVKHEKKEYKEYIEQWVHEIKTPIAGMKLIASNHKGEAMRGISLEIEWLERYVEQVLYYAKSETVEQDYLIRKCSIMEIVHKAIASNHLILLESGIQVEVEESEDMVFTDEKWCIFILGQLITNSIKYRKENGKSKIEFFLEKTEHEVRLHMKDNGIGISEEDLPRIYEKGFTGRNNEGAVRSTGIGLYLCHALCERLGIGLKVVSKEFEFTDVILAFSKENFE
ncbi:MAG: sensor histidine kinase [Lachnospiraceae bacterium]|nr:sensor histidine kinase [Lachnospiraceae bacterium]